MNSDRPPSRPSCAHCPPEPLRTVALSLPHSAHHPTPPHDTAAVRQGQRARGRRRKERERGGARSTQQHRTVHTPTTPHTPPASLLKRAQEPRHDSAKMVQQCHKWSNATHGDEKHNTREASTSKRRQRTIRRTRHTRAPFRPAVRAPPPPAPSLCHRRVARNAFSHPPEKRKQATYIAQPRCGTAWAAAAPTHHTPFSPHSRHLSVAHRHARPTYRPVACGQDDGACSSARGKGPPASD